MALREQASARIETELDLDLLEFDKGGGLIPVIAQHADNGEVLMLGYADRAALIETLRTGRLTFYSRSRERQWTKGETSGDVLRLMGLYRDCDADAVVALVEPAGPTCHTGARSCFGATPLLRELADVVDRRARAATAGQAAGYTGRLLGDTNLRLKKLAEEAAELALACAAVPASRPAPDAGVGVTRGEAAAAVAAEAADLLYHALVACRAAGVDLDEILAVLRRRRS